MPNLSNITSPITLIAPGRSGTSLVANMFERHPDFNYVGETANLIFGIWQAVEFSAFGLPPVLRNGAWVSDDERAAEVVRQSLLTVAPDNRAEWFHKPIGVPIALSTKFPDDQWPLAAEWYWKVIQRSFPHAKYFTILRHPCDVVLSSKNYWGYEEGALWWSLGFTAYLLAHPASPVNYAVWFDDLIGDGERVARELFEYLKLPFREELLGAFLTIHAPAKGRGSIGLSQIARREAWTQLQPASLQPKFLDALTRLFTKFGRTFELPEHILSGGTGISQAVSAGGATQTISPTLEKLQQVVTGLNKQIEQLHIDYAAQRLDLERKIHTLQAQSLRPPAKQEATSPNTRR